MIDKRLSLSSRRETVWNNWGNNPTTITICKTIGIVNIIQVGTRTYYERLLMSDWIQYSALRSESRSVDLSLTLVLLWIGSGSRLLPCLSRGAPLWRGCRSDACPSHLIKIHDFNKYWIMRELHKTQNKGMANRCETHSWPSQHPSRWWTWRGRSPSPSSRRIWFRHSGWKWKCE